MSIMRNSNCDQSFKEGDLVWCKNTSSTNDQINMMYNLCRVIDVKGDNQILLSKYNDYSDYVFLADSENLSKANYLFSLDQNDMMKLRYINEPAVLYHLKERFKNNKYYTKMGPLLIFINPKISNNINNEETIEKYKCIDCIEDLSLNEYHVVHNALKNLNELKRNQSIIISGESGSGKSEIAKNIIDFIAYRVKGSRRLPTMFPMLDKNEVIEENETDSYENNVKDQEEDNIHIEENTIYQFNMSEMLKHVNVVMEAFGNAVTIDNKNSSRFSKFCTIHIENEEIKSFHIKKFLLDKERLINRKANENSFNIFYYMINGSSDKFKKMYFLKNIENYSMLNNEKGFEKFSDYSGKILELLKSLNYIFDDDKEIDFIFSVLSALLLLGNTEIVKAFRKKSLLMGKNSCGQNINYETILNELGNSEDIGLDENVKNLLLACKLLSFDIETFVKYFTTNYIFNDSILIKVHNETKIQKKLENFIKTCYEELFNWIIYKINEKCTQLENINANTNYINILDMAYFENSKDNSLEQLLINTTNEEIIKIKNNCLYKQVVLSYNEDGIFCEYNMENIDNEPLYDLLVGPTEGSLFSLLENVSTKTIYDKSNLHASIIRKFGRNSKYIKKNDITGNKKTFVINHSCGDIIYNAENFVEKNIDILTNRFIDMVKQSENEYMRQFCMFYNYDNSGNIVEEKRRYSIQSALKLFKRRYDTKNQMAVSLLRNNLTELEKLQHTTFCHFIICMKPNESKRELCSFDANIVLRQVRNFSIVEASQLKVGYYPHKFTLNEFLSIFDIKTKTIDEENAEDQYEVVDVKVEQDEDADVEEKVEQDEDVDVEENVEQYADAEENVEQYENEEEKVEQSEDVEEKSNECLKEKVEALIKSYQINNYEWMIGNNMVFISNYCLRLLIINIFPKYEHFNISYEQHIEHMKKSALYNLNDVSNLECVKFDDEYIEQEIDTANNDKTCSGNILRDDIQSNKEDKPKKGSKNRLSQLYQFFGFKKSSKFEEKKNSIKKVVEEQIVLKEDENNTNPIDDKCNENIDKNSNKNNFEILNIVNKNRIKINESIKQFFNFYNCCKPYAICTKGYENLCYASFAKRLTMGSDIFQSIETEKYQAIQDLFGEKVSEQEDAASEAVEKVEVEEVKEFEKVEVEEIEKVDDVEEVKEIEKVEEVEEIEFTKEASEGPVEGIETANAETIGEDICEDIEPMNEESNKNQKNNGQNKKKKRRRRRKRKSTSTVKSEPIDQKEELPVGGISNETEDKEVSVETEPVVEVENVAEVESVVDVENVAEVESVVEVENVAEVESVEEVENVGEEENAVEVESVVEEENAVEVESVGEEKQTVTVEDVTNEIKEDDGEVSMEQNVMIYVEEVGTKENINEIEINENEEISIDENENLKVINCELNEMSETEESIEKENTNENNCDDDENKLFENNKETQQDINNTLNDETKVSDDDGSHRNSATDYLKMILSIEKEDFNNVINFNNYENGKFKQFISCYNNLNNVSFEEYFKNVNLSNYIDHIEALHKYGPEIAQSTNKDILLNNLNDLFVYKSKEKESFMTILKNMATVMENVHGKKWNILMAGSEYYFKSYLYNEDKIIYANNNNDFSDKITYNYEEDKYDNEIKNNGINKTGENKRHSLSYTPIVEYLSLSGVNKNIHEICISNNLDKKYFNEKYEILCFRSKTVSKLDYMNAKSFYTSINYKKVKTRCLTLTHIDFTYMEDQMKTNFKQHVINEFINNPNISMDDLSDSLLKLATYFYPSNKGTWCVFISKRRSFTGSINVVKNRYLRMTVKNKNRKYNIIIFETPV